MTTIRTTPNLQQFFYELVQNAVAEHKAAVSKEVEYYLVQLLSRFSKIENNAAQPHDEALCSLLHRALEADRATQISLLRDLGDVALYIAGYFPESLSRKLIDIDYYIRMGGSAYGSVSSLTQIPSIQSLYQELAEKFTAWTDLLTTVSSQAQAPHSEQDLLRLYDMWQRTGSLRALNLLQKEGILPHSGSEKSH